MERLARLQLRLSSPRDGLRWSVPAQWHITLQFFGEFSPNQAVALTRTLQSANLPPARIQLETLGTFPSKGILLVEVLPLESLLALQTCIARLGQSCGIAQGSHPFHPHITLARSRGKIGFKTLQTMQLPSLPPFGPPLAWEANELLLLESVLSSHGASYRTHATLPLVPLPSTASQVT